MTNRSPHLPGAQIIPLRVVGRVTAFGPADAGILFRTGTRTLRPIEVMLLAPILIPVTVVVLLLLLAWFVLWLMTVATLVTANLIVDISRALATNSVRPLSPEGRGLGEGSLELSRESVASISRTFNIENSRRVKDPCPASRPSITSVVTPARPTRARRRSRSSRASRCRSRRSTMRLFCPRSWGASKACATSAAECSKRGSRLSAATVGRDAGQLVNMLFGNSSIHDDVTLHDAEFPDDLAQRSAARATASTACGSASAPARRALTCSALKPQGLPPAKLADLARRFADGGIDYIKDDHGLADQSYSPFAGPRCRAIATALRRGGDSAHYVPSLTGDLDAMRAQIAVARECGIDTVMVAPMVVRPVQFSPAHRATIPDMAFLTHPSLAGAARMAPPLHFGKLFRLLGADAAIFPNHGGRFGYSPDTCRAIARRGARDVGRPAPLRSGPGRRHEPRAGAGDA